MIESVEDAEFRVDTSGRATLWVTIDGEPTPIQEEQKLLERGLVFLGAMACLDPQFTMVVEVDGAEGPEYHQVRGYTNDTRIVGLVRQMLRDIENDQFRPGRVKIP